MSKDFSNVPVNNRTTVGQNKKNLRVVLMLEA